MTDPDPRSLPDLVALPAWGMSTYARRGHDYLAFNSTEWNAGPGTLVVEGFRGIDDPTMDAFQYFLLDGLPVGRPRSASSSITRAVATTTGTSSSSPGTRCWTARGSRSSSAASSRGAW